MRFLDAWKEWAETEGAYWVPPQGYLLTQDRTILDKPSLNQSIIVRDSWTDVVSASEFGWEDKKVFHLGLLPQPFMGDLNNAQIYVLTLNPGYSPIDYFGEYCVPGFREALLRNLRQDHDPKTTPNLHLEPQYAWSGGYGYWHTRLSGVIEKFGKGRNVPYAKARSELGEKLAIIELIPYHSASSNRKNLWSKLKSPELAREFVKDYVVPRVRSGDAIAIVLRGLSHWKKALPEDLREAGGLIRYDPKREARTASLSPSSQGGNAIIKWLCRPRT